MSLVNEQTMLVTPETGNHARWADELFQQEPVLLGKIQTATASDPVQAKAIST